MSRPMDPTPFTRTSTRTVPSSSKEGDKGTTTAVDVVTKAGAADEVIKADAAAAADVDIRAVAAAVAAAATKIKGTTKGIIRGTRTKTTKATITKAITMTTKEAAKIKGLRRGHHLVKQAVHETDKSKQRRDITSPKVDLSPMGALYDPMEHTAVAGAAAIHGAAGETPSLRAPLNLH